MTVPNSIRLRLTFLFVLFSVFLSADAQRIRRYQLIPYPAQLKEGQGWFEITARTTVFISEGSPFSNEGNILAGIFANCFGRPLKQVSIAGTGQISLRYDESVSEREGYRLSIDREGVVLAARHPAGMFRAVQTIRQLLPASVEIKEKRGNLQLPSVQIEDAPVFEWRGIHIDVSRHFFAMSYLRKLVDVMALYKLNKLHLHLTDDQGWRVEIKKYPKLTREGAWRQFNNQDSLCMRLAADNPDFVIDPKHIVKKNGKTVYGGFYTQKELKDLVAYASQRQIEIIPEIDMPGHMMAAINAYRHLSCDSSSRFGEFFSTPVCPCRPAVIEFAEDIFREIMEIFPSEYIHIGGDEVDRSYWEKSPDCNALMEREGMTSSAELQAWFIRRMESFFRENGKKLIGWDEILDGGIGGTAAIMYWRTWVPGAPLEAARNGNKVIMAPNSPMYFSQDPDKNSLPQVYHYEVIPKDFSEAERKQVMGAQGNLWTERVPTESRADYLIMPRVIALSENLWTNRPDYKSFVNRLKTHYRRLDYLGVRYRLPDLPVLNNYAFPEELDFSIEKPMDDMVIRYTLDGAAPTAESGELTNLTITSKEHLRVAAFLRSGRRGDVYDLYFNRQQAAKPVNAESREPGLQCIWYKRAFDSTTIIEGAADQRFIVDGIRVPEQAKAPAFTIQFRGYIRVPEDGVYTFYLMSDDASRLRIAGREVINNDGMHPPRERNGQVVLGKGMHGIELDFIEGGGGYTLKLQYSLDGAEPNEVPAAWFSH